MARGEVRYRITADAKPFVDATEQASREFKKFTDGVAGATGAFGRVAQAAGPMGVAIAAAAGAGTIAFGALAKAAFDVTKAAIEAGGRIQDLSSKTGVGAESLQRLGHAAKLSGSSMEQVGSAVVQMNRRLEAAPKEFEKFGLSVQRLKAMEPDKALAAISEKIAGMKTPAEQTAAAWAMFGRAGAEMLPVLKSNISQAAAEAERLGMVLTEESIKALDDMGDSLTTLDGAWEGFKNQLGASIAKSDGLKDAIHSLTEGLGALARWASQDGPRIVSALGDIAALADRIATSGQLGGVLRLAGVLVEGNPTPKTPHTFGADAPQMLLSPGHHAAVQQALAEIKRTGEAAERSAKAVREAYRDAARYFHSVGFMSEQGGHAPLFGVEPKWGAGAGLVGPNPVSDTEMAAALARQAMIDAGDTYEAQQRRMHAAAQEHLADLRRAREGAFDWGKALGNVAHAFELLGVRADSTLGRIIAGLLAAGAAGQQINDVLGRNTTTRLDPKTGQWVDSIDWKGMSWSDRLGLGASGVQAVAGIYGGAQGMGRGRGAAMGALSGAMAGMSIGGPIGAGVGALVGGIAGFFGGGRSNQPRPEQMTLEQRFGQLAEAYQAGGPGGAYLDFIRREKASGRPIGPVADLLRSNVDTAIGRTASLVGGWQINTAEDARAQAGLFHATFLAAVKEKGLPAAAAALKDAFGKLKSGIEQTGVSLEGFEEIARMMTLGENEAFAAAAERGQMTTDILKTLGASDYLTQGALDSAGIVAQQQVAAALAAGATSSEALQSVMPLLAEAQRQARDYGYEIPAEIAALIADAQAEGLKLPTSIAEKQLTVLEQIRDRLGGGPPPPNNNGNGTHAGNPGGGVDDVPGPGGKGPHEYAAGGADDFGAMTWTKLHGREAVLPADRPSEIVDQLAGRIAARLPVGSSGPTQLVLNGRVLGETLVELIRDNAGSVQAAIRTVVQQEARLAGR